jgi:hypothetical protein
VAPDRPPRLRPISPGTIANNVSSTEGLSDTELIARLYEALATLPPAERAAAVVAIGLDEGPVGVAIELGLEPEDADAVTRNALQLPRRAGVLRPPRAPPRPGRTRNLTPGSELAGQTSHRSARTLTDVAQRWSTTDLHAAPWR